MPRAMRHEEVSEVLGDYARGDLDAATKASVDEHLADCKACTSELKAVSTLRLEHAPLSDIERSRLRREVGEQVAPSSGRAGTARRRWAARLAPGLGAAALLTLVAVGAAGLFTGGNELGDGGADSATSGRSLEESLERGGLGGRDGRGGNQASQSKPEVASDGEEAAADKEGLVEDDAAPQALLNSLKPTFDPSTAPVAEEDLARLATRTGYDSYQFDTDNRSKAGEMFLLAELTRMAPKTVRDQVRSCARRVRSERKDLVFATYGTLTEIDNRPSLVLGFIWQGPPQDRGRYMLWAWPRGSCEEPLAYSASGDKP